MPDFKNQISNIAQDLLNLEINTIIKPTITGSKMPLPGHALIDIAKEYRKKLTSLGCTLENDRPGCSESFQEIRDKAKEAILKLEQKSQSHEGLTVNEEADLSILWRLKTQSDQIKGIYKRMEGQPGVKSADNIDRDTIENGEVVLKFDSDDLVTIRKIWEMGVEEIAIQTVVQLDGDVITRVQPKYTDSKYEGLRDLHELGLKTSLNFWKELIRIVKDMLKSLLSLAFPG